MVNKNIKRIVQISVGMIMILSVMQIMPFEPVVENASAGSSWIQETDTHFSDGTLENLTIEGTGPTAEVKLIKSGLEGEYTVDANTVALWHFNEGSESTAYDETPYGNDGTINGASWTTLGKFGNALSFNGIDNYVNVSASTSLDITDEITIDAWVSGSGPVFSTAKITTDPEDKCEPQLQVVGSKIFYVWFEKDGSGKRQIWTAKMNTDGSGFSVINKTSSTYDKYFPQFQVVGSKIYYVWREYDGSDYQICTAEMNIDGTDFSSSNRIITDMFANPFLQVVGSKIYYVWTESDGSYRQICTAEMNTDGMGFSVIYKTTSLSHKPNPQFQVVGSKIYYVWREETADWQICTAKMNTDGTGFSVIHKTSSSEPKGYFPQLQVVSDKIYYVWWEDDGSNWQICTAKMNTDGTGFSVIHKTTSAYNKTYPALQVVGSKIYSVWRESDGSDLQIWTAEINMDGTGFSATKITNSADPKPALAHIQVVGSKIYYVWTEDDGSNWQIWTAKMNSNIINKGDFYGLGISDSTIKGFVNAGVDGFKYKAEAISQTAGATTESTIDLDWHLITMTYDKSSLKLYVDGTLVDESTFTEAINTNPFDLIIGDNFTGIIDEVRISNIVRTLGFSATGTLTSSVLDTGSGVNFTSISWNPTSQPPNTEIKFQIATNNDGSTWDFVGPDGTSGSYYTDPTGESIWSDHKGDRYLKYKAYFSTTDDSVTPTLQEVTINYNCAPDAPSLSEPPNDEWTNDATPSFSWIFSDLDLGDTQSGFQVLIDDEDTFDIPNYDSGEVTSETQIYTPISPIADGTWYWTVKTQDSDGDWGLYSSPWVVKIDTQEPTVTISSITHIEDQWSNNNDPSFSWTIDDPSPPSGIEGYSYVLDNSPSTEPDTSVDDTDTSYSVTDIVDNTYYFHVRAKDNAGNWGSTDHFGPINIDTATPIVTDESPTEVNVPIGSTITVTFNEPMNESYTRNAFSISPSITGTISWDQNKLIFTPDSELDYETEYTINIGTGAKDLAGNNLESLYSWQFTTIPSPDPTSPTVKSITLSDQSPIKAGTVTFTITFSENMDIGVSPTVTFGKVSPYDTHTITQSSYSGDTWTGTFTINATTGDGTNTISISGAEDLIGNQMVLNASFKFIIDTTSPTVTDTLTGTDVEVTDVLTITFSEQMNQTSVENSITISPVASVSDYSWEGNTLTITFSTNLDHDTNYTATIGSGAEDLAGNSLAEPYSWSFTTKAGPKEDGFPLSWLILLIVIIVIVVLILVLMRRRPKELEEEEEEEELEEEVPPPPPKKAMISEILGEEGEEKEKEELDRLDLPEPDEEL